MTLRAPELAAVCAEIEARLAGQPVQKIVQPGDETVLLGTPRGWLLIDASARAGRLHLVGKPAGTGEAAPAFCMLLRKHCGGARIVSCLAVEGERACELELLAQEGTLWLRLFLFGPAAQLQLVVVERDGERVLGAIGPARKLYDALPAPHPQGAASQAQRWESSAQIEEAYESSLHESAVDDARRKAQQRLTTERRKAMRLVDRLREDLARTAHAEARRKEGDLLLAHLREIPRGASEVTLPDDFTDGRPIVIALDPTRSAQANAERLYKEQRRLHRARGATEARLKAIEAKVAALELELVTLADRSNEQLLADARHPAQPGRERHREARALPYKTFTSVRGVPIYVGRGAHKNDELTFKVARGNDLWMHTRDVPGAHVVVPLAGRDVDSETLIDAATLAAYHSSVRDEAQVDVGYALRKHVRKPKGAPPGSVLVSQQSTVRVRMEPERLKRLLASART